jgi:hypothetical protein
VMQIPPSLDIDSACRSIKFPRILQVRSFS